MPLVKNKILSFIYGALTGSTIVGIASVIILKKKESDFEKSMSAHESDFEKSMSAHESGSLVVYSDENYADNLILTIPDKDLSRIKNKKYVLLKVVLEKDFELKYGPKLPSS